MDDDRRDDEPLNVFDTMLLPLRLPGRVVGNIQTLTTAVVALQTDATRHRLGRRDAGILVDGLRDLAAAIGRIERRVDKLEAERMDALLEGVATLQAGSIASRSGSPTSSRSRRRSPSASTRCTETSTRACSRSRPRCARLRPAMDGMARDVAKIDDLLPDPSDGPLTRLKDTLDLQPLNPAVALGAGATVNGVHEARVLVSLSARSVLVQP